MIKTVIENLFSKPATRVFPIEKREPAPDVRGTVEFSGDNCNYCNACALKCPTNAITVNRAEKTLDFDIFRCITCDCCVEACKKGCVQMRAAHRGPAYERPFYHHEAPPEPEKAEAKTDDVAAAS
jgi:ech hydrogenase subunit F